MIQVIEYREKTQRNEDGTIRVLKGEYEVISISSIDNTLDDLKKRYKDHPRMTIFSDRIVEDKGGFYGIRSYAEIKEIGN